MRKYISCFAFLPLLLSLGSCREAKLNSSSMEPTIKKGTEITVDYTAYTNALPQRWDIVAYKNDSTQGHEWCQRVVGLPGETIAFQDSEIVIDGKNLEYPKQIAGIRYAPAIPGLSAAIVYPYTIPANTYFVLGDNTMDSRDSRYIGPIARKDILGKVDRK